VGSKPFFGWSTLPFLGRGWNTCFWVGTPFLQFVQHMGFGVAESMILGGRLQASKLEIYRTLEGTGVLPALSAVGFYEA